MADFLPQPKHYRKSHRKRKDKKSKRNKRQRISIVDDTETPSLDINSIYRENQNGDLCKKHALVTIISCVMNERKLLEMQNENKDEAEKDEMKTNYRKQRKLKRKWK